MITYNQKVFRIRAGYGEPLGITVLPRRTSLVR